MKPIEGKHPPTVLVWVHEYEELKADNLRLANLVTKFDTALRTIATEAGMTEAYSGIDCDPECKPLVEYVSNLRKALEASNQIILSGGFSKP